MYVLQDSRYGTPRLYEEPDVLESVTLAGLRLSVARVFE